MFGTWRKAAETIPHGWKDRRGMRRLLTICDNCGTEHNAENPVFWSVERVGPSVKVEGRDDSPKDFCSWRCMVEYGSRGKGRP
jgi:hypothetical protein